MTDRNRLIANKRILVANRGEIATRLFRAATELNMQTIAIYSHEDRFSVHRFKADEAYKVGKAGDPLGAYLDWQAIINLAVEKNIDAIHPGYGFLSENPDFAQACERAGILFCGPDSKLIKLFGDKLEAKKTAIQCGLPVIPGTEKPVETFEEAKSIAASIGFPITLKALSGGGGKGIRVVQRPEDLEEAFQRSRSEAKASFGQADVYIEKNIRQPKHIEVQIAGDSQGQVFHFFERDCSVQRRHQKVIEIAPALGINQHTRDKVLSYAISLAKGVDYVGIGTIEFLVDQDGEAYFLEVNPRIQVEHTVTEMITGYDLAQMSILLAAGRSFDHPAIGIESQEDIRMKGVAVQCRITSENPQNNFAPDTGVILAYRPAQGFGIRLDEGFATSGGLVTPYYDSLLVKVTAHGKDLYGAARKMIRALKEFRIRGVRHNIPLLINILSHKKFFEAGLDTSFLDQHPEVFEFPQPRDRATKLLKFIADVSINNPHQINPKDAIEHTNRYELSSKEAPKEVEHAKAIFDQGGTEALVNWIKKQQQLLLTDTTLRDAHQSLFATRLRNYDIFAASSFYKTQLSGLFSLECWGGATFDTCLRFLKEDPWDRLARLREAVPNILLQMLIRGDNAVGYTNYPKWVVDDFIRLTVDAGLDIFRIFDCFNNPDHMQTAIDSVKKYGGIAEVSLCYTGNISDPQKSKYDLAYYKKLATDLAKRGADILAIKDMAGLLRPTAATQLVSELKSIVDIPIHLHTHATSGLQEATLLAAAEAGCDIVDGAVASMSGLTSQPSLNAVVAALELSEKAPTVSLSDLNELSRYWEDIRPLYRAFDPGLRSTSTDVYDHEIPGGQYSNLYNQAQKVGLSASEFLELTLRYQEVNTLFGDIIKVTPSSKVVGDMALFLQKNKLTAARLMEEKPALDYPDSVKSFFQGHIGIPYGGFNETLRKMVLGEQPPEPSKPDTNPNDNLELARTELREYLDHEPSDQDVVSYRLYPKVFLEFKQHEKTYGHVESLPTDVFFYGLKPDREIEVELEPGKTLIISLSGMTEPDLNGHRRVFFQLNGFPRALETADHAAETGKKPSRKKADPNHRDHLPAPMPGKVLEIRLVAGDKVKKGDIILVTEAMKMEYAVSAKKDGALQEIFVQAGDYIDEGDLLAIIS